jgi:hypothetical protein
MPLEISEIGVHIAIGPTLPPGARPTPDGGGAGPPGEAMSEARVEAIVHACVQQVLRNLRLREER